MDMLLADPARRLFIGAAEEAAAPASTASSSHHCDVGEGMMPIPGTVASNPRCGRISFVDMASMTGDFADEEAVASADLTQSASTWSVLASSGLR